MSTERWTDERLDRLGDRIEGLLSMAEKHDRMIENNNRLIENNALAIEKHDRLIESNARVIQALANVSVEAKEEREQLFQRMDRQQAIMLQQQEEIRRVGEEIRGLQTENRRILDILLNQQNQGDNTTD